MIRKNSSSESGLFTARFLVAFALCSSGILLGMLSFAATPPKGTTGSAGNSDGESTFSAKRPASARNTVAAATSGPGWSIVTSPNVGATQTGVLLGVACTSASDCWAVGYYLLDPGYDQTLTEQWNGTSWSIITSPSTSSTQNNYLESVTCVSASDCWAVGYYFNSTTMVNQTLIEQWNGTSWAIVTSPNTLAVEGNALYGVTCASASECWAVGFSSDPIGNVYQTLIEQWNGTSWAIVTSPNNTATQGNVLFGVTCASASECWAVGDYFNIGTYQTLIEQWNGTSWAIVTSPSSGTLDTLDGVTCASASECWAVGYAGGRTLIEQWNGTSWAIVTSPNTGASQDNYLFGVTCVSASDCWAVGYSFNPGAHQTLIEQWNGTSWAIVTSPNTGAAQDDLPNAVTCVSAWQCWTVGYYYNPGVNQTLIEEYSLTIPPLTGVVSRMTHGSITPPFDISLPLTGTRGVECRTSASLGAGNYTVVFTFVNNVTNCGTAGTTGGSVSSGPNPNQCTENLTGVPNAQYTAVTLNNVLDSQNNTGNVLGTMGVLIGDVNASGVVTSGDTNLCKAQALKPVTNANFRNDINASGAITTGDVNIIKQNALSQLPSPP